MKSMPTLKKLSQRRIDEIAIEVAAAQSELDNLRTERAMMEARRQAEMEMSANMDTLLAVGAIAPFLERNKAQTKSMDDKIAEAEAKVERIRERLMEAYREKARLDTLERVHLERQRAERKARDQAALDEAALTRRD